MRILADLAISNKKFLQESVKEYHASHILKKNYYRMYILYEYEKHQIPNKRKSHIQLILANKIQAENT